jgi:small subunit ribosomal protein S9
VTEVAEVYTSETAAPAKAARTVKAAPSNATGRRKEAIARVRLVPGTGRWGINGRDLAN